MFLYIGCIILGLVAGILGGSLGVGGGVVMVPAMIMLFGLTHHQAQGTALAVMMLPVFVLSVWKYHQAGNVNIQMALLIASGFVFGALIGANIAHAIPEQNLKKVFGVFLVFIGLKFILGK